MLLNQIKENSINNCEFLKLALCLRGGHCGYSPRSPKNLDTRLDVIRSEVCVTMFLARQYMYLRAAV